MVKGYKTSEFTKKLVSLLNDGYVVIVKCTDNRFAVCEKDGDKYAVKCDFVANGRYQEDAFIRFYHQFGLCWIVPHDYQEDWSVDRYVIVKNKDATGHMYKKGEKLLLIGKVGEGKTWKCVNDKSDYHIIHESEAELIPE